MFVVIMLIDLAFDPHAPRQYGVRFFLFFCFFFFFFFFFVRMLLIVGIQGIKSFTGPMPLSFY